MVWVAPWAWAICGRQRAKQIKKKIPKTMYFRILSCGLMERALRFVDEEPTLFCTTFNLLVINKFVTTDLFFVKVEYYKIKHFLHFNSKKPSLLFRKPLRGRLGVQAAG